MSVPKLNPFLLSLLLLSQLVLALPAQAADPAASSAPHTNPQLEAIRKGRSDEVSVKAAIMNWHRGDAYMQYLRSLPGMQMLPDGLQYRVLKPGNGTIPRVQDIVKCNFKGRLIDGTVFEQSQPGKPVRIRVEPLIPGLKEALSMMPTGSRWEIYVPPALGFTATSKPAKVPETSVLIYDVELLEVIPQELPAGGAVAK